MEKKELLALAEKRGEELFKKKQDSHDNSLDSFCLIYTDGTDSGLLVNEPCFASVKYVGVAGNKDDYYHDNKTPVAYMVFCYNYKRCGVSRTIGRLSYLKWLFNDSPYKDVFVTKSSAQAWKGSIILDCSFSPQEVISAAISVRYVREYNKIVQRWVALSRYMNKDLAYILAHMMNVDTDTKTFNWAPLDNGHKALGQFDFGKKALKNFLGRTKAHDIEPMSKGNRNYYYLASIWEGDTGAKNRLSPPPTLKAVEVKGVFGNLEKRVEGKFSQLKEYAKDFLEHNGVPA